MTALLRCAQLAFIQATVPRMSGFCSIFITMKFTPIILILLASISCIAQTAISKHDFEKVKVPYQSQCVYHSYLLGGGAHYRGNIKKYFKRRIDKTQFKKVRGCIMMDVFVDSTGKACCKGFSNNTNVSADYLLSLRLDTIINNMPIWKPSMFNGKPINATVLINLYHRTPHRDRFELEYVKLGNIRPIRKKD